MGNLYLNITSAVRDFYPFLKYTDCFVECTVQYFIFIVYSFQLTHIICFNIWTLILLSYYFIHYVDTKIHTEETYFIFTQERRKTDVFNKRIDMWTFHIVVLAIFTDFSQLIFSCHILHRFNHRLTYLIHIVIEHKLIF